MSIHPVAAELEISALAQEHHRQLDRIQHIHEANTATAQVGVRIALFARVRQLGRSLLAGPEPASSSRSFAAEQFARRQSSSATVGN